MPSSRRKRLNSVVSHLGIVESGIGRIHCGLRANMNVRDARPARAGTSWHPVDPLPTTATRFPSIATLGSHADECITGPLNEAIPAISGMWGWCK